MRRCSPDPGYTSAFAADLAAPGLRVPLTANPQVFRCAVAIGKRVLWLHSYGQRFSDPTDGRPKSPPRLPHDRAPHVLGSYPIPGDPEHMPDVLGYDPETHELSVGDGRIGNVTLRMREYDVSGVNVLNKWFGYRRRNRERPPMGARRSSPLQQIQATAWRADYTSELIDLLHVLGLLADLEPEQAELLARIVDGPMITVDELTAAHVLPVPAEARTPPKAHVAIGGVNEFWLLRRCQPGRRPLAKASGQSWPAAGRNRGLSGHGKPRSAGWAGSGSPPGPPSPAAAGTCVARRRQAVENAARSSSVPPHSPGPEHDSGGRVHGAVPRCLFTCDGLASGRPRRGGLMDPIIVPVLTALIGVAMRAIAVAELLARLRSQERRWRADRSCLTELARALPRGCRLDELRADGSELHLVIAYAADPAGRPST